MFDRVTPATEGTKAAAALSHPGVGRGDGVPAFFGDCGIPGDIHGRPWPILVLTLEGDEQRRAPLLDWLAQQGLDHRLFFGVDGRGGLPDRWADEIDRAAARKTYGRGLTDGEFACALSHREIYRWIGETGAPGAIVLEDDALPGPAFAAFLAARAHERLDLVMFDHSHARIWRGSRRHIGGQALYRLSLPSSLTTAYAVSAGAAGRLRAANTPVRWLADWPGNIVAQEAMVVVPPIVGHPDGQTGTSHLRSARENAGPRRRWRGLARFADHRFWRRWITKRLSRRVS